MLSKIKNTIKLEIIKNEMAYEQYWNNLKNKLKDKHNVCIF